MIVVFGSINLDLIFSLPDLPAPGETVLGPSMKIEPGGKGANQAVAAARDGARVVFAGAVGRDPFAEPALRFLAGSGVDLDRVSRIDGATGVASISVDPAGRNMISVASGANLMAKSAIVEEALLVPGTTLVLQLETDPAEIAALIVRARAAGARIILNYAPAAPMPIETLRAIDILVLNEQEAAWLAGRIETAASAKALHQAMGNTIVVTLGGKGLEAHGSEGGIAMAAADISVVDTTAAGDCFTGVLAAALDRGLTLPEALRRANVAAGLCCTKPGTQGSLPYAAETDAACPSSGDHDPRS